MSMSEAWNAMQSPAIDFHHQVFEFRIAQRDRAALRHNFPWQKILF
jgi:hypothetical protein